MLYVSLILIIISCTKKDNDFLLIDPVLVGKGNLNGSEGIAQQNLIIKNTSDWENLIAQFNDFKVLELKDTDINFDTFQLIAVFDQVYGNGGHSIDITRIVEYDANIAVTIEHLETGDDTSVVTQPFHIVKIPLINKPIIFENPFFLSVST